MYKVPLLLQVQNMFGSYYEHLHNSFFQQNRECRDCGDREWLAAKDVKSTIDGHFYTGRQAGEQCNYNFINHVVFNAIYIDILNYLLY